MKHRVFLKSHTFVTMWRGFMAYVVWTRNLRHYAL